MNDYPPTGINVNNNPSMINIHQVSVKYGIVYIPPMRYAVAPTVNNNAGAPFNLNGFGIAGIINHFLPYFKHNSKIYIAIPMIIIPIPLYVISCPVPKIDSKKEPVIKAINPQIISNAGTPYAITLIIAFQEPFDISIHQHSVFFNWLKSLWASLFSKDLVLEDKVFDTPNGDAHLPFIFREKKFNFIGVKKC